MKTIRKYIHIVIITTILLSSMTLYQVQGKTNKAISITIDGKLLSADVAPILINNRTMVPFRVVFEALGAQVTWDNEKQVVTGTTEDTTVVLAVDNYAAYVNGTSFSLDEAPMIVEGRVLVPIRFVAESLGANVNWISKYKTVDILTQAILRNEKTGDLLKCGMSREELIATLGEPQRKDLSQYGFYWYIYKTDYSNYIQVGVKEHKVVAFSIFSKNWIIEDVNLIQIGKLKGNISTDIKKANVNFVFHFDKYPEKSNVDVELLAYELLPNNSNIKLSYSNEVLRAWEKQIFDQTNALRSVKKGLKPLIWSELASSSARKHSEDMANKNYFAHESLSGLTPWDRMKLEGINYSAGAENIAAGYNSSANVTIGWWNSLKHRNNILGNTVNLGVGNHYNENSKFKGYFTQDFFTAK